MLGEDHELDGLAADMADGTVSRGRALKLAGAALLGSALSLFSAQREADANHLARQRRRCRRRGGTFCYGPHRGAYAAVRIAVLRRGSARRVGAAAIVRRWTTAQMTAQINRLRVLRKIGRWRGGGPLGRMHMV